MANLKSSKKQARQNIKRFHKNLARKTAIKTAIKRVLLSLQAGANLEETRKLLRDAEAKLARASSKKLLHANTARRKVSRLAQKVARVQQPSV